MNVWLEVFGQLVSSLGYRGSGFRSASERYWPLGAAFLAAAVVGLLVSLLARS